jgi:hypothetical protein
MKAITLTEPVGMNKRHTMRNYQARPLPVRCKSCGDIKRPVALFYSTIGRLGICANCIINIRGY